MLAKLAGVTNGANSMRLMEASAKLLDRHSLRVPEPNALQVNTSIV
jgi:hypothetical protein